jgi:DNA-binding LacI/PurR family transcriptional regulator
MSSLQDVARLAEVSITTVSKILNTHRDLNRFTPACVERVHDAARQVNYVPNFHAQRLREGKTFTVGVPLETLVPETMGNSYFAPLLNGVRFALSQDGYAMTVFSSTPECGATTRCIGQLRQGGLDGMVIPGTLSSLNGRVWSDTSDLPIVMVEPQAPMPFPCVTLDFALGVEKTVAYLAELGHRQALWLGAEDFRYQAFTSAAWKHGVRGKSCFVAESAPETCDTSTPAERARQRLQDYLVECSVDFSVVVCWNDTYAAGAIRALRAEGYRIPQDISVVGFDDCFADMLDPPLTTISHRLFDMGSRAAEILLEGLKNPDGPDEEPRVDTLAPELIVRASTAPPRA